MAGRKLDATMPGYLVFVRIAAVSLILCAASLAAADRLITIPTGSKIPFRTLRAELALEPSRDGHFYSYLGVGVTTNFDLELRTEQFDEKDPVFTFDFTYNYTAPLAGFTPGISFGLLDVPDNTEDGRRGYLAISFREPVSGEGFEVGSYIEVTLGAIFGSNNAGIVGVNAPLAPNFRFLAEHNGEQINTGFELRPGKGVYGRVVFQPNQTLLSVGYTHRF